jgi:hypothetical protein
MNRFEDELRQALRREEPPDDFTERVLARAESLPRRSDVWWALAGWFRRPAVRFAAVVASLLLVIAVQEYRVRQARAEGERAKGQLMLALQITGSKLHAVHQKVLQLTSETAPERPARKIL